MLKANRYEIQTLHETQENEKHEICISIKKTLGYLFLTGFDPGVKKKKQNCSLTWRIAQVSEFLANHISAVLPTYFFCRESQNERSL